MKYAGLDISKNTIDVALKAAQNYQTAQFSNDSQGRKELSEWLKQHQTKHVCMEATGKYHLPIALHLSAHFKVSVENPLKIKKYNEITLKRTKTDKQDAKQIADYCASIHPKLWQKPNEWQLELNELLACQQQLTEHRSSMKKRQHNTSQQSSRISYQNIINALTEEIERIKKQIAKHIKSSPSQHQKHQRLQSINGIGEQSATGILHYLERHPFTNVKQYIAYLGLCPSERTSGTSIKKKSSLTKYGHRRAKSYYFMPALVAYRNNYYPNFIGRLKAKGKPKKVIIVALMRKLATIAYYLHKTESTFDASRYCSKPAQ